MGQVFLNPNGNGTAYVDNPNPNDGERFTIHSIPDPGETLDDIRAFDSHDYPIAIPTAQTVSMIFRASWGNLYVDIYFLSCNKIRTLINYFFSFFARYLSTKYFTPK